MQRAPLFTSIFTATAALTASVALSAPITVGNHSFETQALADYPGGGTATPPTGWLAPAPASNFVAVFNPSTAEYSAAAGAASPTGADGANIAAIYNAGSWIWKSPGLYGDTQSATVIAEGTYTLTVAVGQRLGGGTFPIFIQFRGGAGDPIFGATLGTSGNFNSSTNDAFEDFSFSIVIPNASPLIGQNLGFGIFSTSGASQGSDVDNVRLNFDPIPEPATAALALLGVALTLPRRRPARA